jgi:hypothetical protein
VPIKKTTLGLVASLVAAAGCATSRPATRGPAPPQRLLILPLRAVGLSEGEAAAVRAAIVRELARELTLASDAEVATAVAGARECEGGKALQDPCALAAGASTGASQVLAGAVGGIGKTFVVQLRLLHVRTAAVRTVEETLFGEQSNLLRAAGPIALRLVNVSPPKPWYTRWWLWTAVGAAVAAGVVVPVVLTRDRDQSVHVPLP